MCYRCLNAVLMMCMSFVTASAFGAPRRVSIDLGDGSTGNTASVSAPTEASAGATEETVKVSGRGVGADEKSALEDAFRDAIERVIGLYVDAETVAKNDEIVKDQILTHSNAYVTHYDKQSAKPMSGGLTEVRILATVKKRPLTQKIHDVMPTQTTAVNATGLQNAFAQMTTTAKRADDAAALLENALSGLNPVKSLLVANVRPETQKIITADGSQAAGGKAANGWASRRRDNTGLSANQVALRYLFELRLDREKYFKEFVPNLKRVLEQIALTPPKEVRLSSLASIDRSRDYSSLLADYKAGKEVWHCIQGINGQNHSGPMGEIGLLDNIHVYSAVWNGTVRTWSFGACYHTTADANLQICLNAASFGYVQTPRPVEVVLITELNPDATVGKAAVYELDAATQKVWDGWMKTVTGAEKCGMLPNVVTHYSIVLADKDEHELAVFPWEVRTSNLMCIKFADVNSSRKSRKHQGHQEQDYSYVFITPFVGCFGDSYIEWRDLAVSKDLLPKIDSIKIELAQ